MTGVLTLVSTPIGNLGDLAPRAVEALEAADLVCCEDTRRTGSLLKQIGVRVDELRRLDDHTEFESIPVILDRLGAAERVVLVSDAGTPGISDPGERLVAAVAARAQHLEDTLDDHVHVGRARVSLEHQQLTRRDDEIPHLVGESSEHGLRQQLGEPRLTEQLEPHRLRGFELQLGR